jgi:aspartate ammonia-lyase
MVLMHNSIGIVTALNPQIGYENTSRIAKGRVAAAQLSSQTCSANANPMKPPSGLAP